MSCGFCHAQKVWPTVFKNNRKKIQGLLDLVDFKKIVFLSPQPPNGQLVPHPQVQPLEICVVMNQPSNQLGQFNQWRPTLTNFKKSVPPGYFDKVQRWSILNNKFQNADHILTNSGTRFGPGKGRKRQKIETPDAAYRQMERYYRRVQSIQTSGRTRYQKMQNTRRIEQTMYGFYLERKKPEIYLPLLVSVRRTIIDLILENPDLGNKDKVDELKNYKFNILRDYPEHNEVNTETINSIDQNIKQYDSNSKGQILQTLPHELLQHMIQFIEPRSLLGLSSSIPIVEQRDTFSYNGSVENALVKMASLKDSKIIFREFIFRAEHKTEGGTIIDAVIEKLYTYPCFAKIESLKITGTKTKNSKTLIKTDTLFEQIWRSTSLIYVHLSNIIFKSRPKDLADIFERLSKVEFYANEYTGRFSVLPQDMTDLKISHYLYPHLTLDEGTSLETLEITTDGDHKYKVDIHLHKLRKLQILNLKSTLPHFIVGIYGVGPVLEKIQIQTPGRSKSTFDIKFRRATSLIMDARQNFAPKFNRLALTTLSANSILSISNIILRMQMLGYADKIEFKNQELKNAIVGA